eukprot:TRINITY_DN3530_c0_g1_i1.p1 TRINITY_DN3530_c0_g1~~TRINITY_DN3530_c0_g1_i1.p1  ORF type:complete len:389 (+),score=112.11 TRINITY_DN3530_c0_g1_i1:49-1167(+)
MLNLNVVPGKSLGFFYIGMPLPEAIGKIQSNQMHISKVQLKYETEHPLDHDIVLDLNENGIMLRFEPISQRLIVIEVYNVDQVNLTYNKAPFCSPDTRPTFDSIYSRIGPTFPGHFYPEKGQYYLHYPGLAFVFDIPAEFHQIYTNTEELPNEFPNGVSPITSRMLVYIGSDHRRPMLPQLAAGSPYFEPIVAHVGSHLAFPARGASIPLQASVQDVLSVLGPPSQVFYKDEDKVKIHSEEGYSGIGCADYFYNYFALGFDILFDINTHTAKKFILHTNFPSYYNFHRYSKCNFTIFMDKDADISSSMVSGEKVTPDTKWKEIQDVFGKSGRPTVHTRPSSVNPFGATHFYGYKHAVFEIMTNLHIASVCLF